MRTISPTYTKSLKKTVAAMGDSLTQAYVYADLSGQYYHPERVAVALRALGIPIKSRNFGVSGSHSSQMLSRQACLDAWGAPDLCLLWCGYNDTGLQPAISSLTRSGSVATAVLAGNHGLVTGNSVLISGATQTDYNGTFPITVTGLASFTYPITSSQATTATGSPIYTIARVTTVANIVALGTYIINAGCPRVLVYGRHYVNFAGAGGDNAAGPVASPTPAAGRNANFNQDTKDAVAALQALYPAVAGVNRVAHNDIFTGFYNILVANPGQVGSDIYWHQAVGDIHLRRNPGEQTVADLAVAAITAQTGWLTALGA